MKRFLCHGSSSSSGLANASMVSSGSEAGATTPQSQIASIHDVERWLAKESIASSSSPEVQRIREAVAVLLQSCRTGSPRRDDVRPLLGPNNWNVANNKDKKPRPIADRIQELQGKVIKAAQKLERQLPDLSLIHI